MLMSRERSGPNLHFKKDKIIVLYDKYEDFQIFKENT
jgi:hypothetical protein